MIRIVSVCIVKCVVHKFNLKSVPLSKPQPRSFYFFLNTKKLFSIITQSGTRLQFNIKYLLYKPHIFQIQDITEIVESVIYLVFETNKYNLYISILIIFRSLLCLINFSKSTTFLHSLIFIFCSDKFLLLNNPPINVS